MSRLIPGRQRWICPVCSRPTGRSGDGLSRHFHGVEKCPGTGTEVAVCDPVDGEPVPESAFWVPPPLPVDPGPFRRWRSYGWTDRQIAAVTGEGALW